jgi:hypothetical protein
VRYEVETLLEVGRDDRTILHYIISSHSSHLRHFRVIMESFRMILSDFLGDHWRRFRMILERQEL